MREGLAVCRDKECNFPPSLPGQVVPGQALGGAQVLKKIEITCRVIVRFFGLHILLALNPYFTWQVRCKPTEISTHRVDVLGYVKVRCRSSQVKCAEAVPTRSITYPTPPHLAFAPVTIKKTGSC